MARHASESRRRTFRRNAKTKVESLRWFTTYGDCSSVLLKRITFFSLLSWFEMLKEPIPDL
jgi:hypothetical protein